MSGDCAWDGLISGGLLFGLGDLGGLGDLVMTGIQGSHLAASSSTFITGSGESGAGGEAGAGGEG